MEQTAPNIQPTIRRAELQRARVRAITSGVLAAIGCGAVGYFPTLQAAGSAGVTAMAVALAIGLIGSVAAMIPTVSALSRPVMEWVSGAMIGLGLRFGLTLGLGLAAAACEIWPRAALLLWVGLAQLIFLATDTAVVVRLLRRMPGSGN